MHFPYFNVFLSAVCFSVLSAIPAVFSSPVDYNSFGCQQVDGINSVCSKWFQHTQLPNVFGHATPLKAFQEMTNALRKVPSLSDEVASFMCVLYLPPCTVLPSGSKDRTLPLPCRATCEKALSQLPREASGSRVLPVMCHTLPSQRCYMLDDHNRLTFVRRPTSSALPKAPRAADDIVKFTSLEAELGDNEVYDLEVVTLSDSQKHGRRYDITDFGDPDLFQGWVDVQGAGAANDYCRVIGKAKRRFLSCNLAGSESQGHHYVSKLGFEVGHPHTWFMRDMDGDGRDDYCRCVGPPADSKVTCMKAGEKGFYGSSMQSGSQHSFVLTSSHGCHNRRVNALFGE